MIKIRGYPAVDKGIQQFLLFMSMLLIELMKPMLIDHYRQKRADLALGNIDLAVACIDCRMQNIE